MSSVQSNSFPQSPLRTLSSGSLRFLNIRPAADALKKVFQKLKSAPLIRRFKSEYIPYEEWKTIYMAEQPEEMVKSKKEGVKRSTAVFDYGFTDIRKRTQSDNSVRAERLTPHSADTLDAYQETVLDDNFDETFADYKSRPENTMCNDVGNCSSDYVPSPGHTLARADTVISSNQIHDRKVDSERPFPRMLPTVARSGTESDDDSTVGSSEYAFGRDYDLTKY